MTPRSHSSLLLLIAAVLSLGVVPSMASPSPSPSPASDIAQRGRFTATVTYGPNTALARQPDQGAMVFLFPRGYQPPKKLESPSAIIISDVLARADGGTAADIPEDVARALPKFATADGAGKVVFTGLPAGQYRVIVVSMHTMAGPNARKSATQILGEYFTASFYEDVSKLKLDSTHIDVLAGENTEKTFHFD
jgi:hypothetical protein